MAKSQSVNFFYRNLFQLYLGLEHLWLMNKSAAYRLIKLLYLAKNQWFDFTEIVVTPRSGMSKEKTEIS